MADCDNIHARRGRTRYPGLIDCKALTGFSPLSLSSLWFWGAARKEVAYADTDLVPTFTDWSPSANDATQANAALQPAYNTGIINGQPVLTFANDYMRLSAASAGSDVTFFFVIQPSAAAFRGLWDTASGAGSTFRNYNTSNAEWHSNSPVFNMGIVATNKIMLTFVCSLAPARRIEFWKDGVSIGPYTHVSTSAMVWNSFTLGAVNVGGGGYFPGYVAEVIICNSTLSDEDVISTHEYLNRYYALY